jgi:hypothetical protein
VDLEQLVKVMLVVDQTVLHHILVVVVVVLDLQEVVLLALKAQAATAVMVLFTV